MQIHNINHINHINREKLVVYDENGNRVFRESLVLMADEFCGRQFNWWLQMEELSEINGNITDVDEMLALWNELDKYDELKVVGQALVLIKARKYTLKYISTQPRLFWGTFTTEKAESIIQIAMAHVDVDRAISLLRRNRDEKYPNHTAIETFDSKPIGDPIFIQHRWST